MTFFGTQVWTEAQEGLGAMNFITGMGGFLQAILYGYGGIRIGLNRIDFKMTLPPGLGFMEFNGNFLFITACCTWINLL